MDKFVVKNKRIKIIDKQESISLDDSTATTSQSL